MSNVPNKMKMPTAITDYSKQTLTGSHTTTTNIMELSVPDYMELVPGQSIKFHHKMFTRFEPMPVPTFGDCYIHNRAFFVPYRTVFPDFNSFITDTVAEGVSNSSVVLPTSTPVVTNGILRNFIINHCTTLPADHPYPDIVTVNSSGTGTQKHKLTTDGARYMKIIQSLGYGIDFNYQNPDLDNCALQLLALAKVYMDWYYPSVYAVDEEALRVTRIFNQHTSSSGSPYKLTYSNLTDIFSVIDRVCYDADYYTSAWDNPVAPNNSVFSTVSMYDLTSDTSDSVTNSDNINGTPNITTGTNGIDVTQYSLDALKALNDYFRRHQMSGARVLDRYLSRFGVQLDSAILDRSLYLGSNTGTVNFGNVTSTADTDGARLGNYSGIGIGSADGTYQFETDEYGLFLIVSSVVPKVGYFQGADRITMHTSKFDFYTNEFDNLGVQALATREVYMPMDASKQYPNGVVTAQSFDYNALVFGFVPRYAEYKRGKDKLTGDYRLGSRSTGKDAWYLYRDVAPYFESLGIADAKHSADFVQSADADQYDRIFYANNDEKDHLNVVHLFRIESHFPGKSLYDTYEFEDEDKAKKVSIDVNGVKAN